MSEDKEETPEQKTRWSLLVWFFLSLLIYFVSAGPMWKLVSIGKIPDRVLMIYNPIYAFRSTCPPVDHFYVWYMSLWGISVRWTK